MWQVLPIDRYWSSITSSYSLLFFIDSSILSSVVYGWREGHGSIFEWRYHITCHHSTISFTHHHPFHHTGSPTQSRSVSFVSPNDYKSLLATFSDGSWSHPGLELQHGFISCLKTWPFDACENLSLPSSRSQLKTINYGSISWQESLLVPV
jgi:hypothetical protein